MEVKVHNINGEEVKTLQIPDSIYGLEMNEHVLHSVVKAYRANRRQGTHATKTRSMVSGGGKKPFKQKGTGNARQGSTRSPLHPGGAVVHGPQPRDYSQKTNKKTKQLALKIALSDKAKAQKLIVLDQFSVSDYSTSHIAKILKIFNIKNALLADERKDDFLFKSARNIHGAKACHAHEVNAEDVLRYESLIISETGINALHQRLEEKNSASV